MFEFGEDLLDGVQIGRVGRQEQQAGTDAADRFTDGGPFVTAQIIHDDDIARRECRHEELLDIVEEGCTVDRLIEDTRCVDPVAA